MMTVALIACTTGVNAQTLRDKSGNSIGKIESDGTVRDKSNRSIGKADGIERRYAALFFFFGMP